MKGLLTRPAAAVVLAALPLVLAACVQVRLDSPPAWLTPTPAPQQAPTKGGAGVWFVRKGKLVRVARSLGAKASPLEGLGALFAGPTAAERKAGITTAIPTTGDDGSTLDFSGYAHVDLPSTFARGGDAMVRLRMAQVVYTLTESKSIKGVLFEIEGKRAQRLGGVPAIRPLVRRDFGTVAP